MGSHRLGAAGWLSRSAPSNGQNARSRIVIIEDRGPLAWLFLNDNLHVVHHRHPNRPWYDLPAIYAARRDQYLRRNKACRHGNDAEVCRRHVRRAKEPVPHPLWYPPSE